MNGENIGDALRSWVEYGEHMPRAQDVPICQKCESDWPCVHALRAERDAAEIESDERGQQLLRAGIVPHQGGVEHPEAHSTARGRALYKMFGEMMEARVARERHSATHAMNVLAWHVECGPHCHAFHHEEVFVMAPGAMTRDDEEAQFTDILAMQYGAMYCQHRALPPSEQDAAIKEYVARDMMAVTRDGSKGDFLMGEGARAEADAHAVVAYRVGFHTMLPFEKLRARLDHFEAIERAQLAEKEPAGDAGTR